MKVNTITNINFRENTNTLSKETKTENAILMLRDPNASVKFKQSQEYARKADSVDSNPIVALGYKLYRTFNMITNSDKQEDDKQFKAIA